MLTTIQDASPFHTLNLFDFDDCMFATSEILRPLTNTLLFEAVLAQCTSWGITPPLWASFVNDANAMRASAGSLTKAWQHWLEDREPTTADKTDPERFNTWAYDVYRQRNAPNRMLKRFQAYSKPDAELRPLLESLSTSGHRLAIFTQNHKGFVRMVLEYNDINHLFPHEDDIIDIVDTNNHPKTSGVAFLYARERYGYGYASSNMLDDKLANFSWARISKFRCWHIHPNQPPVGMADVHYSTFKQALAGLNNPFHLAA